MRVTKWEPEEQEALSAHGATPSKIWRYDSATGERALREYEFDAPEEATLLDCLDIVKDQRRLARLPQELPDDDLRLVRHAHGRRAVLACKTRMHDIVEAGRVPVISAMGNLPIVKDLVVDMEPFWTKFKAMKPWLQPGYDDPEDGKEYRVTQERMNVVHKEALCINCGCCVSECNAMESDPEFLGPQALAKGFRFVGDPRDAAGVERLEALQLASTASGSARAATSATSAARRASTRATRSRSSGPSR